MGQDINVEGTNWNRDYVASFSDTQAFVDAHLSDAGTYKNLPPEARETALQAVHTIAVPAKVIPQKPEKKKD